MGGGDVRIAIFDVQGNLIRTLIAEGVTDEKKIVWDATDDSGKKVSSGVYFARASTPQNSQVIKLLYLK
jgi:flagellar hook assembly protein FlgD